MTPAASYALVSTITFIKHTFSNSPTLDLIFPSCKEITKIQQIITCLYNIIQLTVNPILLLELFIQFQILLKIHTIVQYVSTSQLLDSLLDLFMAFEQLLVLLIGQIVIYTDIHPNTYIWRPETSAYSGSIFHHMSLSFVSGF